MVHSETSQRLTGDKAPKLKHLEQWLMTHPKYKVDLNSMFGLPATTTSSSAATTASSTPSAKIAVATPAKTPAVTKASTTSTSVLSTPIASTSEVSPGSGLEPGEIPKPKVSAVDPTIGVFHRLTGINMPTDKSPSLSTLAAWLDKNPDYNVQTSHGAIAKVSSRKTFNKSFVGRFTEDL